MSVKPIRRLPQHVTETVWSTAQAADLPSAACELVLNSIQAGARSIQVTANIAAWSITVEDDGCGIPAASIPLLGQRSCTSKQGSCRGEALASLAQLSQHITITSRAAGTFETHKKQLLDSTSSTSRPAQGATAHPSTHAKPSTVSCTTMCPIQRQRQGTTVALVGFLHNQPVRRNRLLQQYAGATAAARNPSTAGAGGLASSTAAAATAAAAAMARASNSALQDMKQQLFVLMMPHTGVELVLQQAGSSAAVLHLPKDRSLDSCLQQLFQQHPTAQQQPQHNPCLQHIRSQHNQGWQVSGCVLTSPAPALSTKQHQLLYVNSRSAACPVLAQLLRDWFIKHVKTLAGQGTATGQPPGSSRAPEPGYVLLITCPAASYTSNRLPSSTHLNTDFSSSMGPLCDTLQASIGPFWGSLPSIWRKAAADPAAAKAASKCQAGAAIKAGQLSQPGGNAGSSGSGMRSAGQGSGQATRGFKAGAGVLNPVPAPIIPAHGLQMASHTRSLAGVQASTAAAAAAAAGAAAARPGRQPTQPGKHDVLPGLHNHSQQQQQPTEHTYYKLSKDSHTQPQDSSAHVQDPSGMNPCRSDTADWALDSLLAAATAAPLAAETAAAADRGLLAASAVAAQHHVKPSFAAGSSGRHRRMSSRQQSSSQLDSLGCAGLDAEQQLQYVLAGAAGRGVSKGAFMVPEADQLDGWLQQQQQQWASKGAAAGSSCGGSGCSRRPSHRHAAISSFGDEEVGGGGFKETALLLPGQLEARSMHSSRGCRADAAAAVAAAADTSCKDELGLDLFGDGGLLFSEQRQQAGGSGYSIRANHAASLPAAGGLDELPGVHCIADDVALRASGVHARKRGYGSFTEERWCLDPHGQYSAAAGATAASAGASGSRVGCGEEWNGWDGWKDAQPQQPLLLPDLAAATAAAGSGGGQKRQRHRSSESALDRCFGAADSLVEDALLLQEDLCDLTTAAGAAAEGRVGGSSGSSKRRSSSHTLLLECELPTEITAAAAAAAGSSDAGSKRVQRSSRQRCEADALVDDQATAAEALQPCCAGHLLAETCLLQDLQLPGAGEPASPVFLWLLEQAAQQQQHQSTGVSPMAAWLQQQEAQQQQQMDTEAPSPLTEWMAQQQQQEEGGDVPPLSGSMKQQEQHQQVRVPQLEQQRGIGDESPTAGWIAQKEQQQQHHGRGPRDSSNYIATADWLLQQQQQQHEGPASPMSGWLQLQEQQQQQEEEQQLRSPPAAASPMSLWLEQQQQIQQQQQQQQQAGELAGQQLLSPGFATPPPRRLSRQQRQIKSPAMVEQGAAVGFEEGVGVCLDAEAGNCSPAQPHYQAQYSTGLSEFLSNQPSAAAAAADADAEIFDMGFVLAAAGAAASAQEAAGSCDMGFGHGQESATGAAADSPRDAQLRRVSAAAAAAAAAVVVAPFINPAAAALSEDTVQIHGLERAETSATAEGGSGAESAAAPAAAAAAAAAGCGTPPSTGLPDVLLLPFSQRLLQSAPPAAKKTRVFARSERLTALCHTAGSMAQHSMEVRENSGSAAPCVVQGSGQLAGRSLGAAAAATSAGRTAAAPAAAASTTAQDVARSHRRHTSPAVMQQDSELPAVSHQQQQGLGSSSQQQQQQQHKQLLQTRLPFRTINGELPSAAKLPALPGQAKTAATAKRVGPLKPAWLQPKSSPHSSTAAAAAATTAGSGAVAASSPAPSAKAAAAAAAAGTVGAGASMLEAAGVGPRSAPQPRRSSLKGSRNRDSLTSAQQQQQQGQEQPTQPRKRVRFSDIGGSQQQPCGDGPADMTLPKLQQQQQQQSLVTLPPAIRSLTLPATALVVQPRPVAAADSGAAAAAADKAAGTVVAEPARALHSPKGTADSVHVPAVRPTGSSPGSALQGVAGISQPRHWAGSSTTSRFFRPSRVLAPPPPAAAAAGRESGASGGLVALRGSNSSSSASQRQHAVLTLEELAVAVPSLLVPPTVTRQQLQEGTVIAQADNKLIATRCGPVLLAVDQHAADERVQLEALQQLLAKQMNSTLAAAAQRDEQQGQRAGRLLSHHLLQPPQQLSLALQEAQALQQYQPMVKGWGWKVSLTAAAAAAAGATAGVGMTQAAVLQQVPVLAGVTLGAVDLQLYLHQLVETCGSSSQPPPGVLRVLRSKACRTAIMFGDALGQQQCKKLVQQLAATELCFMCAHGRPTTVALVDLHRLAGRLHQWQQRQQLSATVLDDDGTACPAVGLNLKAKLLSALH